MKRKTLKTTLLSFVIIPLLASCGQKEDNFDKSKESVNRIDDIRYNEKENLFEFDIDYSKFTDRLNDTKNKWTLCSYGERILTQKNANGEWFDRRIQLSIEFKNLFEKYVINLNNIKDSILKLDKDNIIVDAFNRNIDGIENTEIACFDEKPYFNVGIDNAFGFDPEKDWDDIYNYISQLQ